MQENNRCAFTLFDHELTDTVCRYGVTFHVVTSLYFSRGTLAAR
jgi:hypothetical protein